MPIYQTHGKMAKTNLVKYLVAAITFQQREIKGQKVAVEKVFDEQWIVTKRTVKRKKREESV